MIILARHTNSTIVSSASKFMLCVSLQVGFRTLACSAKETIKMCVLWLMSSMPRVWDLIHSISPLGWPHKNDNFFSLLQESRNGKSVPSLWAPPWCGLLPGHWSGTHRMGRATGVLEKHAENELKAIPPHSQLTHLSWLTNWVLENVQNTNRSG